MIENQNLLKSSPHCVLVWQLTEHLLSNGLVCAEGIHAKEPPSSWAFQRGQFFCYLIFYVQVLFFTVFLVILSRISLWPDFGRYLLRNFVKPEISKERATLTDSNTSHISPTACLSFPLTPAVIMEVYPGKESPHTSDPNTRTFYTSLFPYCRTILPVGKKSFKNEYSSRENSQNDIFSSSYCRFH
jgi:hypothetical protein